MVHFYSQFFEKGSSYILGKRVMHPCVPFCSGAPLIFLVHPSVHRAHRLKSTGLHVSQLSLGASMGYKQDVKQLCYIFCA